MPHQQPAAPDPDATLADVGEMGVVARLLAGLPGGDGVLVGPGDDAAVVAAPDGRSVLTVDLMVEGRHFRRSWSSAADVGHRAAARSLSDVAAMGGRATALVVGLAAPPDLPVAWVLELAQGVVAESALVGAVLVGGDTVRADSVVVSVTAVGDLAGREPLRRGGAHPGDVVAVTGRLGWAEAGLAVLTRGFRSPRVLVEAHRRPQPPYAAGPAAAAAGASALVDVSDGLVQDLSHVAAASGVTLDLDPQAFTVPEPLRDVASALGGDPLRWVLAGGDDHALAGCFPAGTDLPEGWVAVGRAMPPDGAPRVLVGGEPFEGSGGHEHFRG